MTHPTKLKRLEVLIWVLIFGGLMTLVFGLSLERYRPESGLLFVVGGALLALIGAVLIFVRARLKSTE